MFERSSVSAASSSYYSMAVVKILLMTEDDGRLQEQEQAQGDNLCGIILYFANTSYVSRVFDNTYFTIANNTYQGLTTCNALMRENPIGELDLYPVLKLQVPLRCACPTNEQIVNGTKFLLTYLVTWKDKVPEISHRFNVSSRSLADANGFPDENSLIYPFTTILIPLPTEPLSTQIRTYHQTFLSNPSPSTPQKKHKRFSKALRVGIGTAASLAVFCFVLCVSSITEKNRSNKVSSNGRQGKKLWKLQERILDEVAGIKEMLKIYSLEELEAATGKWKLQCTEEAETKISKNTYSNVANGLHYLHNFTAPAYVHKDINSCNILLNGDLRAKIANFSHARLAQRERNGNSITSCVLGAKGYMAPEYLRDGNVTPKIDVYAFGFVLLELITGKEAVFVENGVEVFLSETIMSTMGGINANAEIKDLMDPRLQVKNSLGFIVDQTELAVRLVKLSVVCLAQEPENRLSMAEVVSALMKIQLDVQNSESYSIEVELH
ncbi:unnamed protein product [Fraxinus pennsylvanica]|uniref:Uncharacterized protein n=1 Tax=Fraxinus pennsylvanica TaxID=56036 RepID=A0AAD2DL83_9LAMI|nr:unnamed protein product [Fraxinus pennsylvanica]